MKYTANGLVTPQPLHKLTLTVLIEAESRRLKTMQHRRVIQHSEINDHSVYKYLPPNPSEIQNPRIGPSINLPQLHLLN